MDECPGQYLDDIRQSILATSSPQGVTSCDVSNRSDHRSFVTFRSMQRMAESGSSINHRLMSVLVESPSHQQRVSSTMACGIVIRTGVLLLGLQLEVVPRDPTLR